MRRSQLRRYGKDGLRIILVAVCLLLMMRVAFWPTRVMGHSMADTLQDGQVIFISRLVRWLTPLQQGDVVVVVFPAETNGSKRMVKRVIARPGQHVVIQDQMVYVDGEPIEEVYKKGVMQTQLDYVVPKDEVFLLGDHRSISKDSRTYGCVPMAFIKERVLGY